MRPRLWYKILLPMSDHTPKTGAALQKPTAQSLILEAGKSPELRAVFLGLAEITRGSGEPWHLPDTLRRVEQTVACRAYALPVHQLCHLIPVAEALGGRDGYPGFFYSEAAARGAGCRALLRNLPASVGTVDGDTLRLRLTGGGYDLTLGAVPRLVCLMQFLHSFLGYAVTQEVLGPLLQQGARDAATLSGVSNTLCRVIYEKLTPHLPTVQAQKRSKAVIDFMADRAGEAFGPEQIDDAAILDLWDIFIDSQELGHSFEAAYLAALDLRRMLVQGMALKDFERQTPIGPDREQGEVMPDAVLAACETLDDLGAPLALLNTPPADRVKALNKQEAERLKHVAAEDTVPLALTLLRLAVFRPAHRRLSQGRRDKLSGAEMARLIETAVTTDYAQEVAEFTALASHLSSVRLACAAALAQAGHEAAFEAAAGLITEEERSEMQRLQPQQSELRDALEACGFLARATAALKKINRRGYRPADLAQEGGAGHAATQAPLTTLHDRLTRFLAALDRSSAEKPWATRFIEDHAHFTHRFQRLFGESS